MALALLCCAGAGVAQAEDVYKWVDTNGTVHYGDQPVGNAQKIEVRVSPAQQQAPAPASDPAQCANLQQKLAGYKTAASIDETNALGVTHRYSDDERAKLIADTEQKIAAVCSP